VGATGGGTSHEIPEIFKKVKGNEKVLDFQKNHITTFMLSRSLALACPWGLSINNA